jgi:hypothetical protein
MLKYFYIILAACLQLMLPIIVYADLIPPPPGNPFIRQHKNECVELEQRFYANSEGGFVSLKKEPGSEDDVERFAEFLNGTERKIFCTYDYNGETWGLAGKWFGRSIGWIMGWVPMNQLLPENYHIYFFEKHIDEFYPYVGNSDTLEIAEKIVLWLWPGSDKMIIRKGVINANKLGRITISHAYKDEQGREWVFISCSEYGIKNVWICISDPNNEAIQAFNPSRPADLPPADINDNKEQPIGMNIFENEHSVPLFIIFLVTALIAGTAVLIRVFWKPNCKGG